MGKVEFEFHFNFIENEVKETLRCASWTFADGLDFVLNLKLMYSIPVLWIFTVTTLNYHFIYLLSQDTAWSYTSEPTSSEEFNLLQKKQKGCLREQSVGFCLLTLFFRSLRAMSLSWDGWELLALVVDHNFKHLFICGCGYFKLKVLRLLSSYPSTMTKLQSRHNWVFLNVGCIFWS